MAEVRKGSVVSYDASKGAVVKDSVRGGLVTPLLKVPEEVNVSKGTTVIYVLFSDGTGSVLGVM